jgi:hypothetical protein
MILRHQPKFVVLDNAGTQRMTPDFPRADIALPPDEAGPRMSMSPSCRRAAEFASCLLYRCRNYDFDLTTSTTRAQNSFLSLHLILIIAFSAGANKE